MYEQSGGGNAQHDKSVHGGPSCFDASYGRCEPSKERKTTKKKKTMLRTDHVLFEAQVCGEIPQRYLGRNRAQQVRLSELPHISEIQINTSFF